LQFTYDTSSIFINNINNSREINHNIVFLFLASTTMGSPPASKAQMNFVSWVHGVATEGFVSWWETSQKNDKGYGLSPQKKHELQNQKYAISTQLGDSAK